MAPSRRAKSRSTHLNKTNSESESSVTSETNIETNNSILLLDDAICKICLNIMIKPVTMPCQHDLCYTCFESCVQKANLACPMCRKRISVWCRQATRNDTLINKSLWRKIQLQFPDQVQQRIEGRDAEQDPDEYVPVVPTHQFAEPGEIFREFEAERERLLKEEEKRRKEEERASAELISLLKQQEEEEMLRAAKLEEITKKDEALAQMLHEEAKPRVKRPAAVSVSSTPSPSCKRARRSIDSPTSSQTKRPISTFFSSRPETKSNQGDSASSAFAAVTEPLPKSQNSVHSELRSCSGASSESIESEISKRLHFRPINAAPLTPPKHLPGSGKIVKPQVVPGTARNLSLLYDENYSSLLGDVNHNQTLSSRGDFEVCDEFVEIERQLRERLEQEKADRLYALKLQKQLDAELKLVNRAKGTHDQYHLRQRAKPAKQTTIEESFHRPLQRSSQP